MLKGWVLLLLLLSISTLPPPYIDTTGSWVQKPTCKTLDGIPTPTPMPVVSRPTRSPPMLLMLSFAVGAELFAAGALYVRQWNHRFTPMPVPRSSSSSTPTQTDANS
ncbi:hypothetical protein HMI56_002243 [Coelomomyces lativittatus]|nr:hypothetical protein HMI56_002243 [Coelomomyces lativittatus]